jgi:hypothetical protein
LAGKPICSESVPCRISDCSGMLRRRYSGKRGPERSGNARFIFYLRAMINNFKIDFEGAEFEFNTMHTIKLQLFQVYAQHEGKKVRFHMQRNEEGKFYITDMQACPEIYRNLENTLSEAIIKLGETK